MIRKLILIVVCFISLTSMAQNLIGNGDFENYSALPYSYHQFELATGWSNLNNGTEDPYATPDYLHTMGSGPAMLPDSYFGTVNPYSGNGIAGFITYNTYLSDFREYLSTQLVLPMRKDSTYIISFWLSNGTANWYGRKSSNHIGIRFSTQPLIQAVHEPIGGVPQIEISGQPWSVFWQNYTFSFTADSNYNFFTLGNFYDDISTTATDQIASGNLLAYYFVDKIEVYNPNTVPVLLKTFNASLVNKKVILDWAMQQEINSKDFVVERSADQIKYNSIGSRNAAGNSNTPTYYTLTDNSPLEGINYYRLKMIDADGKYDYTTIRKIKINADNISLLVKPNPVEESFSLEITSKVTTTGKLTIYDITGKAVYKRDLNLKTGKNDIPVVIPGLRKGEHVLQVLINDESQSIKIMRK